MFEIITFLVLKSILGSRIVSWMVILVPGYINRYNEMKKRYEIVPLICGHVIEVMHNKYDTEILTYCGKQINNIYSFLYVSDSQ